MTLLPLLSALIWLTIYAVRRWLPSLWKPLTLWPSTDNALSVAIQSVPSVLLGVALELITGAPLDVLSGIFAPFIHHGLKWLPVPYQGPLRDYVWTQAEKWIKAKEAGKL